MNGKTVRGRETLMTRHRIGRSSPPAALAGLLLTSGPADADDVVMEWNQIALAATETAGQGPVPQIRTMAIVQVSVHDAVNAITCEHRTYLSIRCGPRGTPEAAAIARGSPRARRPAARTGRGTGRGPRRLLRRTRIDRQRSRSRLRRSRRGGAARRSCDRWFCAGAVSVHRSRAQEVRACGSQLGPTCRCFPAGRMLPRGSCGTSRHSNQMVRHLFTPGAMRATTTR